jgi:hypothetical protein
MIVVKLMGGLGNQMFQYAAGRALAIRHKTSLYLDLGALENTHPEDTPRVYELGSFPIEAELANKNTLERIKPSNYKAKFKDRLKRQFSNNGPIFTYGEPPKHQRNQFLNVRNNSYLVGYWQDEVYFSAIRDNLLKEFEPIKISASCKKYLKHLEQTPETIAVHVRRGDYVTNIHANKHHGLASKEYYQTAIKNFESQLDNPEFFVFSDDIEWCKKNINAVRINFIEDTLGYEDMHLMSHCKHNIIANSSFSWWGAWLNNNSDKIVIAPKVWFQNKDTNQATSIVPGSWIRL